MKPIKVIITDDHEVVIDGLIALLANEPDIDVIGKALNGEHLLELLRQKTPDIVLMDIEMPGLGGIETTRQVKQKYRNVKVIMLTMYNKREYISEAISGGADGYLLKNTGKRGLIEGIHKVFNGEFFLPSGIAPPTPGETDDQVQLTNREREIICLIVEEFTTREIADQLFIAPTTVEKHRQNIMAKLEVRNVAGLVKYALEHELCNFSKPR